MNYLRYSSDEMFSSTELIRKSKMIFDKLNKKEVEKAIILRDGKPGFMLLDFATYEKIMQEYIELKSGKIQNTDESYMSLDEIEVVDKVIPSNPSMQRVEEQIKAVETIVEEANKHTQTVEKETLSPKAIEEEEEITQIEQIQTEEINDEELQKALEEIEKINMETSPTNKDETAKESSATVDDDFEVSLGKIEEKSKKQPLKEFWD